MKSLKIGFIAAALLFTVGVFAEEIKSSKPAAQEQTVLPKEKKSRKKKVEMCAECGKPESECECDHEKKEDKK